MEIQNCIPMFKSNEAIRAMRSCAALNTRLHPKFWHKLSPIYLAFSYKCYLIVFSVIYTGVTYTIDPNVQYSTQQEVMEEDEAATALQAAANDAAVTGKRLLLKVYPHNRSN